MPKPHLLRSGEPWPDGQHGEVVSPSGIRAYLSTEAADLCGKSPRWVAQHASDGSLTAERGRIHGRQGGDAWFVQADEFEALGRQEGWWPPGAHSDGSLTELRKENAALRKDKNRLLAMIRDLAQMATGNEGSRNPDDDAAAPTDN